MNSEDKFKKQLEDKLRSKEFSFDDANWHSMREMIDESRNKKKRRVLVLLFLLVGLLGSVSLYLFTYNEVPAKMAINKRNTNSQVLENQTQAPGNTAPAGEDNNAVKVPEIKADSKNKPTVVTEEIPSNKISTEPKMEGTAVKNTPAIQAKQTAEKTKQIQSSKPVMASTNQLPPAVITSTQTKAPETIDVNTAADVNKTPDVAIQVKEPETKTPAQEPVPSTSLETKDNADVNQHSALAVEEKTNAAEPKAIDSSSTQSLSAAAEVKKDSAIVPAIAKTLHPDSPAYAKHILSLEAGANYMAGWKVNDKRDGNGLNFVAGINYLNFVTRKVGVSAGMHYTSLRNLSAFSHTSTVTKYGFGEKTDVTIITPEKIHYLQLPLKVHVRLNDKNFVGAGYTLGYLLTVNSKTEKHTDGFNYETTTTISKKRGYTEGFSSYDSQISIFYRRMIYKKLFINAEAILGLTDTRKNAFFVSKTAERNMGLKLTLMYNIFQK